MANENTSFIGVRVSKKLLCELRRLSKLEKVSVSELVREALADTIIALEGRKKGR